MNIISKLFTRNAPAKATQQEESTFQETVMLTAKEIQLAFIEDSLKPLLKANGYKTAGNKWWKVNHPFFNLIELQNFSWNSGESLDFCFNFTTGLVSDLKNLEKPTIHDGITYVRESYFGVKKGIYWGGVNGYHIEGNIDLKIFTAQVLNDFESHILPQFNLLVNKDAIENFYSDDFWGPRVKQSLKDGRKSVRLDA